MPQVKKNQLETCCSTLTGFEAHPPSFDKHHCFYLNEPPTQRVMPGNVEASCTMARLQNPTTAAPAHWEKVTRDRIVISIGWSCLCLCSMHIMSVDTDAKKQIYIYIWLHKDSRVQQNNCIYIMTVLHYTLQSNQLRMARSTLDESYASKLLQCQYPPPTAKCTQDFQETHTPRQRRAILQPPFCKMPS